MGSLISSEGTSTTGSCASFSSRSFIFSASAVPAAVGAALAALRVIREDGPQLFERLLSNAEYLREGLRHLGLKVVEPGTLPDGSVATTPVVPVMVGDDWQAVLLWKALFEAGVYTNVAIHPAVPPGGALLLQHIDPIAHAG